MLLELAQPTQERAGKSEKVKMSIVDTIIKSLPPKIQARDRYGCSEKRVLPLNLSEKPREGPMDVQMRASQPPTASSASLLITS
jgi:hypothetical protein